MEEKRIAELEAKVTRLEKIVICLMGCHEEIGMTRDDTEKLGGELILPYLDKELSEELIKYLDEECGLKVEG